TGVSRQRDLSRVALRGERGLERQQPSLRLGAFLFEAQESRFLAGDRVADRLLVGRRQSHPGSNAGSTLAPARSGGYRAGKWSAVPENACAKSSGCRKQRGAAGPQPVGPRGESGELRDGPGGSLEWAWRSTSIS